MERELGKDLEQGKKRVAFLMDNCDAVEEKGYMKPFTPEELARMKESLSETDIEINDIEEEKTAAMKDFKARLEPLTTERKKTLEGLKRRPNLLPKGALSSSTKKPAKSAITMKTATLSRAGRRTAKNYKQHFSKSEEKQVLTTKKQNNDEARFNYCRWQ